jgi:hypothetical protein
MRESVGWYVASEAGGRAVEEFGAMAEEFGK